VSAGQRGFRAPAASRQAESIPRASRGRVKNRKDTAYSPSGKARSRRDRVTSWSSRRMLGTHSATMATSGCVLSVRMRVPASTLNSHHRPPGRAACSAPRADPVPYRLLGRAATAVRRIRRARNVSRSRGRGRQIAGSLLAHAASVAVVL